MNNQPIEKHVTDDVDNFDVVDIFHTIQGEGPYTGHPAIFIRLAGCNLQCPACDTDYTTNRYQLTPTELINAIKEKFERNSGTWLLVFTGGEPFRQNIVPILNYFTEKGIRVQVETNGTFWPYDKMNDNVVIICSPKTAKINHTMAHRANAFKYVLDSNYVFETDGLPSMALQHPCKTIVARPPINFEGGVYLQAMDTGTRMANEKNQKLVLATCLRYGYILQLQTHKIIGVD